MADKRPIIGVTMGDPAGVGPEIVLGALKSKEIYEKCIPVVIGHVGILRRCSEATGISAGPIEILNSPKDAKGVYGTVEVVHVETPGMQDIMPGTLSADAGRAADAFVKYACELALAGEIDAISTTPINKESLRLANVEHIGHTEMLATYLDSPDPLTLFITENMRGRHPVHRPELPVRYHAAHGTRVFPDCPERDTHRVRTLHHAQGPA